MSEARHEQRRVADDGSATRLRADLEGKKQRAIELIKATEGVVVALSGGVDSAVLLQLSLESLGADAVLAVTGRSPSLAPDEIDDAVAIARFLGARHEIVDTRELERPGYRANAGNRCYHCRTELFEVLAEVAARHGLGALVYGAIADDLGDFRPGMDAARERGVRAPLLEAGITKAEVRRIAAASGLPVRDKPASACLSSRIPVGTEVTESRLSEVARAESVLRELGFRLFRVRHHGEVARLELDAAGTRRLADPDLRSRVAEGIQRAGFRYVALDLQGYRTGSLNPPAALHRIRPARDGGQ